MSCPPSSFACLTASKLSSAKGSTAQGGKFLKATFVRRPTQTDISRNTVCIIGFQCSSEAMNCKQVNCICVGQKGRRGRQSMTACQGHWQSSSAYYVKANAWRVSRMPAAA